MNTSRIAFSLRLSYCLIVVVLCSNRVQGHGRLTFPATRDQRTNTPEFISNAPTTFDSMFVCRNLSPMDPTVTLTTGKTFDVEWEFTALHVGDCFLYLSYDTFAGPIQMQWFKIAQFAQCNLLNRQRQQVMLPSYLPQCDHCVLRWEWYALHQWPAVEFYSQCVDVSIVGSTNGILPSPMVTVPANLPPSRTPGAYRNPFDPSSKLFLTGPPLATLNGDSNFPTPLPLPNPTPAPTPPKNVPTVPPLAPSGAQTVAPTAPLDCSTQRDGVYCEQGDCCPSFTLCASGMAYRNQAVPPGTVCSNGIFVAVNTGGCLNRACSPPTQMPLQPTPTAAPKLLPTIAPVPGPTPAPTISCPPNNSAVKCYPGNCCSKFYVCDSGKPSSIFSTGANGVKCYNGGFLGPNDEACRAKTCSL